MKTSREKANLPSGMPRSKPRYIHTYVVIPGENAATLSQMWRSLCCVLSKCHSPCGDLLGLTGLPCACRACLQLHTLQESVGECILNVNQEGDSTWTCII